LIYEDILKFIKSFAVLGHRDKFPAVMNKLESDTTLYDGKDTPIIYAAIFDFLKNLSSLKQRQSLS